MVYALDISQNNFGPAKYANIATLLNVILPLLMIGAALIFLIIALLGAFTWLTSGGVQENLVKARKTFTSAIIGLIIVVFSFVLVRLIGHMLQVNILPQ